MPIFETLVISPAITEAVENGVPASKIREIALSEGMVELAPAGMEQVLAGRTTVEEVFYKLSG
jgi:type IV pilus assembly protein PilB